MNDTNNHTTSNNNNTATTTTTNNNHNNNHNNNYDNNDMTIITTLIITINAWEVLHRLRHGEFPRVQQPVDGNLGAQHAMANGFTETRI